MKIIAALIFTVLLAAPAFADDEVSCDSQCDSGKKLISFLDGEVSYCQCVDEGHMEETVPNPELPE